jgi:hypothetical protein
MGQLRQERMNKRKRDHTLSYKSQGGQIGLLDQVKLGAFLGLCSWLYSSTVVLANDTNKESLSKCYDMMRHNETDPEGAITCYLLPVISLSCDHSYHMTVYTR